MEEEHKDRGIFRTELRSEETSRTVCCSCSCVC